MGRLCALTAVQRPVLSRFSGAGLPHKPCTREPGTAGVITAGLEDRLLEGGREMKGWGTRAVATAVTTAAVMAGVGGLDRAQARTSWLDELAGDSPDLNALGAQG